MVTFEEMTRELIEKGLRYFPDVNPSLFEQKEEWYLYFSMVVVKEKIDACLEKGDFLGALKATAELTYDKNLS